MHGSFVIVFHIRLPVLHRDVRIRRGRAPHFYHLRVNQWRGESEIRRGISRMFVFDGSEQSEFTLALVASRDANERLHVFYSERFALRRIVSRLSIGFRAAVGL